ncbi:hypothetical protein OHD62_03705 [Mesorhizobium sp. YC-39]|uniref:hypothetical protein n=1 Tax=unclassified Mesorhizobium TaxID=325217 RepID=UPI0021E74D0B|nr:MULTISPECIES: hypothetical protein [unclassified Mesorhizobium]MCV3206132.1 hypothetical protein [Mesorhizobium sp. YC-2]MCV3227468.1 hypothetical protein [Mesorhizobium sp. YC-39]
MNAAAPVASDRGLITEADIDRGYDACAIARVCELAMETIPDLGKDALVYEAVGAIVRLLRMAGEMTGESLNVLELAKTRQADTKA